MILVSLSYTGLKWRSRKEPLIFRLGVANLVLLCSLCSFVLWALISSDPVYEIPAMSLFLVIEAITLDRPFPSSLLRFCEREAMV